MTDSRSGITAQSPIEPISLFLCDCQRQAASVTMPSSVLRLFPVNSILIAGQAADPLAGDYSCRIHLGLFLIRHLNVSLKR